MARVRKALWGASIVAALAVAGWTWLARTGGETDRFAACRTTGIAEGSAAIGGPFTLVDENGKTVTDKDVFTKPSLVYFGYTFCPDVCPVDNARNAEALDILLGRGYDAQAVFISIDPERDTPQVVKEFTDYLHPKMIGLTGTPQQVKAASQAFRTYYRKRDSGDGDYLVDHSTFTYLVLPDTGFVEFFKRDTSAREMADRTACFIDKSN